MEFVSRNKYLNSQRLINMQRRKKPRVIRKISQPKLLIKRTVTKTNQKEPLTIIKNQRKVFIQPQLKTSKINKMHITSKKEISTVEPIWKGETVYIIGGGPSLKTFNWRSLIGKRTIAINKAMYSYPTADILYFTDGRFYSWFSEDIDNFKGVCYTITPAQINLSKDIKVLKRGQKLGLSNKKNILNHGNNSGFAAMNLAYLLGAKRIILLGYDMGNDGVKGHFHDGYPTHITSNKIYTNQFIPAIESLAPLLKNAGVDVYNASIHSKLQSFKKITHQEALSFS